MAGELNKSDKSDYDLILEAGYKTSEAIVYWNQMMYNKLTDLGKFLIGIASLLIPIIGSVVIPNDKIFSLTESQKISVNNILLILLFSIGCGFIQIIHEYIIFRYYNTKNSERAEAFYNNLGKPWKETKEIADKFRIDKLPFPTFPFGLSLQTLLIGIAIFMIYNFIISFITR